MKHLMAIGLLLAGTGATAESCPDAPDHTGVLSQLYDQLQAAPDETAGQQIAVQFWEYWADAPDDAAQELLDEGMRARAAFDFLRALDRFDRLTKYCPQYAEGYNQRAFVNFIRQDYDAALTDLEVALALNPRHLGALSGKALSLMGLGRDVEAQEVLRDAVDLNPWLPERYLLGKPL